MQCDQTASYKTQTHVENFPEVHSQIQIQTSTNIGDHNSVKQTRPSKVMVIGDLNSDLKKNPDRA